MWLDMRIECVEMSLAIMFEIKVEKRMDCGSLKRLLLDIINQILQAKNVQLVYEERDIEMVKATLNQRVIIVKEARNASVDRKVVAKKQYVLEDSMAISEHFDYLNRYLICVIQKKNKDKYRDAFQRRLTIGVNTCNIVANIFESAQDSAPCRGIRIENCNFTRNVEMSDSCEPLSDPLKARCCRCQIF